MKSLIYIFKLSYLLLIFGIITGCAQLKPMVKEEETLPLVPLVIDNVSVERKTVNISKGEDVVIKYRLSIPADTVNVSFYNSVNKIVNQMEFTQVQAGENEIRWNGRTSSGNPCESDVYTYIIKARAGDRFFTYNPAVRTGNKELTIEKAFIGKDTGTVTYVLPEAAWVRIRLGLRDSALLKTLKDWAVEEGGRHQLSWDGWDKDNLLQFSKDPRVALAIQAISIPMNSVIVKSNTKPDYYRRYQWLISGELSSYPLPIEPNILMREPEFSIRLAKEYPEDEEGINIVSGTVPVTVTLSPEDKEILTNSRFELMFYVDTIFLYEDEQAYTPFTYMWDTVGLKEGKHIFTVNLLGYNMSVGIGSIMVYVKNI